MTVPDERTVLSDVVLFAEWQDDRDAAIQRNSVEIDGPRTWRQWVAVILYPLLWSLAWISWLWSEYFGRFSIPDWYLRLQEAEIPWKLVSVRASTSVEKEKKDVVAAVLTETTLEIRKSVDDFCTTVEEFSVQYDPYSELRKIAIDRSGRHVAVLSSDGFLTVFDCAKADKKTIVSSEPWTVALRLLHQTIATVVLWVDLPGSELEGIFVGYANGRSKLFAITDSGDLSEHASVSCKKLIPGLMKSITSGTYAQNRDLIILASAFNVTVEDNLQDAWSAGISLWRIVNESPYIVLMSDKESSEAQEARFIYRKYARATDGVIKMSLNSSETKLVTLFLSGALAIWDFPSMRLHRFWMLDEIPRYGSGKHGTNFDSSKDRVHLPVDVQWWSDIVIIIVHAGGSVALFDVRERELFNVGHVLFEQFHPGCIVTANPPDMYLILEKNVSGANDRSSPSEEFPSISEDDSATEGEEVASVLSQTLASFGFDEPQNTASRKRSRKSKTYQLRCFQIATPDELFNRHLAKDEFGDALKIAKRFGLNTNLVHQKRWLNNPVTKISIADYLCKVSDSSWVLRECLTRIPDHPDVMLALLDVGLRETSLQTIVQLHPACYVETATKKQAQRTTSIGDDTLVAKVYVPEKVDVAKLSAEQVAMIGHRRQLLRFRDMLSTYEHILGDGENAVRYFLGDEYRNLRNKSVLDLALEYAHNCKPEELHKLRHLHTQQLQPFWLDILSSFPETFAPDSYQFLIPAVIDGKVAELDAESPRLVDWSEGPQFLAVVDQETQRLQQQLEEQEQKLIYRGEITPMKFKDWFRARIVDMERRTGLIDNSKQLLKIAAAKNIKDLEDLEHALQTLADLVYSAGQVDMSLDNLQELSDLQILRLFDNKRKPERFSTDLHQRILPFLKRCERRQPGERFELLKGYVSDNSTDPEQGLNKCLKLFQLSLPGLPDPVVSSPSEVMELAIDCILTCPRTDQLDNIKAILECMPPRTGAGNKDSHSESLRSQLDNVQELIRAVEFVEAFGIQLSIRNLREIQSKPTVALEFVDHLLKLAVQKVPGFTEQEWKEIFSKYSRTCRSVFSSVGEKKAVELFARALLSSGKTQYLQLATKFLACDAKDSASPKSAHADSWVVRERIDAENSTKILLEAGKTYFNQANNWKDPRIQQAARCFELVGVTSSAAKQEKRLIDAIGLLHTCGVDAEPLDIRTSPDRMKFIRQILESNSDAYKYYKRLLELADMLDIKDKNCVMEIVAERAFDKGDYDFCRNLCTQLIDEKRESSWELCLKLAAAEDFHDMVFKDRILLFALTNCSDDKTTDVVNIRNLVSFQRLRSQLPVFNPATVPKPSIEPMNRLILDPCAVETPSYTTVTPLATMIEVLGNLSIHANLLSRECLEVICGGKASVHVNDLLINIASECVRVDMGLALALVGAIKPVTTAEEFFDAVPATPAAVRIAAYFYGLEICLRGVDSSQSEEMITRRCKALIKTALGVPVEGEIVELNTLVKKYQKMSTPDLVGEPARRTEHLIPAGKTTVKPALVGLKGVDQEKFRSNSAYRKDSILRAAATQDQETLRNTLRIAEENNIEPWEVIAAYIKYLYTNPPFLADRVNSSLKRNKDLLKKLVEHKAEFLRYSGSYIQPHLLNADISVLESYLDFLDSIKQGKW